MRLALLLALAFALAGCTRAADPQVDTTGTVFRQELAFDDPSDARAETFPVPRGPTQVHVLVEGRNAPTGGANVRIELTDPAGGEGGSCVCGAGQSTGSFGSGDRPSGAEGRWTLAFEPTGATRIRVTVTTT